jgi:hypothetical protein
MGVPRKLARGRAVGGSGCILWERKYEFLKYLESKGIHHEKLNAYTPQENGMVLVLPDIVA